MNRYLFLLLFQALLCDGLHAQTLTPDKQGELALEIDNLSFFKDNEYEGEQSRGYSLPGFWIQPRLTYQPLAQVRLEAGFHALVFDGANKYPCYAYHDIGVWKGSQYQRGAHVLPFFRAQAQMGAVSLVLGDIYGAEHHEVMEPLWNPELTLTQDPEMGFQILADLPRWKLDAWLNWQSYIFQEATHQEAFTVGIHQRILLNAKANRLHWYLPIDILIQHRGGEQDITDLGVQTITNGGVGIGMKWNAQSHVLQNLSAEVAALGCWQQSGSIWPFNTGAAATVSVSALFQKNISVSGGLFYAKDFVSLYGAPFYSTLSVKHPGARFSRMLTPHVGVEWKHDFSKDYTFGAKADYFPLSAGALTHPAGAVDPATYANNFSFGVYFRCRPRFLLKRF